jgi:hypothetical protein
MNVLLRAVVSWTASRGLPLAAVLLSLGNAASLPAYDVVRVEEDWELVVGETDVNSAGPQIACTMSPFGNINSTHFTMELNHRSMPWWSPGGISIHHWSGEWRVQGFERQDRSIMQGNDETVRWTQILDVDDGVLTFQIKNGSSTTWGSFGYSNHVKLQTGWGVNNINGYTPDVSAARSGVAYAANRVKLLQLKQVRATLSDGTVVTDNTQRIVHELPSP